MTATRDFDEIARAWLDLMPDEAPARVFDAVLDAVEVTPQRRLSLAVQWRLPDMSRLALPSTVAALVLLAGAIWLLPRSPSNPASTPSPSPSASASAPATGALDDALRATWLANAGSDPLLGNGDGPVSMVIGPAGTSIAASNFGPGNGFASSVAASGAGQLTMILDRASSDCAVGARGEYRWVLSSDRSELVFTTLSEECPARAAAFVRRWARSLVGATTVGAGIVDSMNPMFAVTLPDDDYATRTLDDFVEIAAPSGFSLMAFKNPVPFADACSTGEERLPVKPGADAFLKAFEQNDAFVVGARREQTIDGHRVISASVGGKANYARCPGQELYEYTPEKCTCHFIVGQGYADRFYVIEVGSDTFLFIVSPYGDFQEDAVIKSIRIPVQLPSS
jgi:hypothetical protein